MLTKLPSEPRIDSTNLLIQTALVLGGMITGTTPQLFLFLFFGLEKLHAMWITFRK